TIAIPQGEMVAIMGPSGSGKSTFMNLLGCLDSPSGGSYRLDGQDVSQLDSDALASIRNEKIGFVFQFHYLLPEFSVLHNVMLPGLKLGMKSSGEVEHRAMELLHELGIGDQALKKANQVSGGQKQRVAIARALINDPLIIMGDEPTGNLDSQNTGIVFDIFRRIANEHKRSLLIVTHDPDFAKRTDRIIEMDDGRIVR
ncbi:MAG TPA: ABC transporter ATP-binding protein, partial [Flavobacteriales bacterium]|nr:ABC transporter ATP-binding protein [Flavobacteriales bacterium]